jgi:RNA recognition motif-containing protein
MNDGSGWQDGQFYRADMSLDHQKWLTNPLEMDSPNTYREDDEKSNTSIVHRSTSDSLLPHSSNFFPGQYSYSLSNSNNRFEDDVMINKAQSDSRLRVGLMGSLETEDPYSSNMLQFSRHARRLYVGGIPPSYTNEDMLRTFLNEVISKCLEEEYSNGHILSVYMNHKKCFAFVELKSIELATACLELDGIVYKSNILKIQRANEYKPELLPNIASVPVKLNFSKAPFPKNLIDHGKDKPPGPGINVGSGSGSGTSTGMSLIQRCYLAEVRQGNIVLIGFPYDEGSRRAGGRGGSYAAPVSIRNHLQNFFVQGYNPEYNIDLAQIRILDVGDVAPGMNLESASVRLESAITEIIRRGAIPIVLGGSNDVAYWCSTGLISAVGGPVDVVTLNSSLDMSFPVSYFHYYNYLII